MRRRRGHSKPPNSDRSARSRSSGTESFTMCATRLPECVESGYLGRIAMTNRAAQAELLEQRIAENRASQEVDLVRWIFERILLQETDQVLELCCGTGGQTLRMLSTLGERGRIHALDVSGDALSALAERA